ncbi:electron transporter RnfB [Thiospirochaeta perfilievii]|uniref:Electron transporter RnfB n=1 Tax=Thiospirochaeta perfilievii TaxID=252967 RepID=A0A5C1Q6R2_9SPIO|nr:(Fe-S)-binding protein [Thiospirochaeta perfilievii]QEN03181.1 electron transporter RnfB [Thiospirochaeta perfilievii]
MNSIILTAVIVIGVVGLLIGVLLGVASIIFEVKVDERVVAVYNALPHFNCGSCGYPGCEGMANGLIRSEVPISNCKPSKPEGKQKIKEILDSYGIKNRLN